MPLSHSPTTRGVNFAFLFGPPRWVDREEASKIHGAVCEALSQDDISFRFSSDPTAQATSRGFAIQMERQEGRGTFRVIIDHPGSGQPIRLLTEFNWPPSLVHVAERFDMVNGAVFRALEGEWQRVMAEARVRAQFGVKGRDALSFLRSQLNCLKDDNLNPIGGRLSFASLLFEVSPAQGTSDPLEHPRREVRMELLREDRASLYFELMSQWAQVPVGTPSIDITTIRPINQEPSRYVESAHAALSAWAATLDL